MTMARAKRSPKVHDGGECGAVAQMQVARPDGQCEVLNPFSSSQQPLRVLPSSNSSAQRAPKPVIQCRHAPAHRAASPRQDPHAPRRSRRRTAAGSAPRECDLLAVDGALHDVGDRALDIAVEVSSIGKFHTRSPLSRPAASSASASCRRLVNTPL